MADTEIKEEQVTRAIQAAKELPEIVAAGKWNAQVPLSAGTPFPRNKVRITSPTTAKVLVRFEDATKRDVDVTFAVVEEQQTKPAVQVVQSASPSKEESKGIHPLVVVSILVILTIVVISLLR